MNDFPGFFKYVHKVFRVDLSDHDNSIYDIEENDKNNKVEAFIICQPL